MNKKHLIPEGSKIIFYVNDREYRKAEAMEDMEVYPNSITMIDGLLVCTDSRNPVERLSNTEYKVKCWFQDYIYISDGKAYSSASNAD